MQELFELGRLVTKDSVNKYLHLAYINHFKHYRLISSGEVLIKGKNLDIPEFVKAFIHNNNQVLMMANIISGKVVGLTFRTVEGPKDFLTWGNNKGNFYGLGQLSQSFKYGDPIILVEGLFDCDVIKQYYPNTMAVLTSGLTKNQTAVLTRLTNNVILMLDNDEAGKRGTSYSELGISSKCNVRVFRHHPKCKDPGDIITLKMNGDEDADFIEEYYKRSIQNMVGD